MQNNMYQKNRFKYLPKLSSLILSCRNKVLILQKPFDVGILIYALIFFRSRFTKIYSSLLSLRLTHTAIKEISTALNAF